MRTGRGLTLVFTRTKHGAERLMKDLERDGFAAASVHGNKSQGQRDRAIKAFRAGTVKVLVATDVAARGIDIPGVAYVVNYDLPEVPENYVHRIGRTARAGREGEALALCSAEEVLLLRQIQRLMKIDIPGPQVAPSLYLSMPRSRAAGAGARVPRKLRQRANPPTSPAAPGAAGRPNSQESSRFCPNGTEARCASAMMASNVADLPA